jgi:hypothetical protein
MLHVFSMVLTGVVIAVAVFITVINPTDTVTSALFWQMPLVSAVCTLISLIYPWDREMGKTELIIKTVIHYILVNVIVLGSGALFYWYNPSQFRNIAAMVLAIAVIFGGINAFSWKRASSVAARLNEKLEEYHKKQEQD